jgi:hypothetical protein
MMKLFASLTANTQNQLREQAENHAMEIAAMKQTNMDTQNLLMTKTTPTQTLNNHRTPAHFTAMTKPSEILFDGKPENYNKTNDETETATLRISVVVVNGNVNTGTVVGAHSSSVTSMIVLLAPLLIYYCHSIYASYRSPVCTHINTQDVLVVLMCVLLFLQYGQTAHTAIVQ